MKSKIDLTGKQCVQENCKRCLRRRGWRNPIFYSTRGAVDIAIVLLVHPFYLSEGYYDQPRANTEGRTYGEFHIPSSTNNTLSIILLKTVEDNPLIQGFDILYYGIFPQKIDISSCFHSYICNGKYRCLYGY